MAYQPTKRKYKYKIGILKKLIISNSFGNNKLCVFPTQTLITWFQSNKIQDVIVDEENSTHQISLDVCTLKLSCENPYDILNHNDMS